MKTKTYLIIGKDDELLIYQTGISIAVPSGYKVGISVTMAEK